ncbi:MAG TPA: VCBS repeat-containing protein, partial [Candidatus Udaeobacter sp.]|nr:VCBS repeat-containing protein [Candidatus Udaeobacter sp.]
MWLLVGLLGCLFLLPNFAQAVVDFDPARHDFVCGRLVRDVAPIDFNSDGHQDLACVRFTIPGVITLLEGDGQGNFRFFGELPAGDGATAILSADINEDHHPDLVTTGFLDTTTVTSPITAWRGVSNGTIGLHLGDGQGNFTYEELLFAPGIGPFQVNAADLDGDHHLDLVSGGTGDGVVRIFKGNGQGQFTPGPTLTGPQVPQQTAIGDIDGDIDPDLAVADNMGEVLLFRNDGAGNFGPAQPLEVGREPVWIDIRTFEDRARPYLAVALRSENTVQVFQWDPAADAPLPVIELSAPIAPIYVTFLTPTFFHDPARGGGQDARRRPGLAVVSQTSSQMRVWPSIDL